ncbi:uncharacterized protein LOC117120219 [Anneissia japonica]|uniref:uncharacterized protein LOC117120219 n=1 Tax=Anneissia japonica TaxID=1529436 RepID=UPI0014254C43|nr:uncharacterized protein LOC117120219 [Anneissia japonica]
MKTRNGGVRPQPVAKFPCKKCKTDVAAHQHAIQCDDCISWYHRSCLEEGITLEQYTQMMDNDGPVLEWRCPECTFDRQLREDIPLAESTHRSFEHICQGNASTNNTGLTDLLIAIYEHGDADKRLTDLLNAVDELNGSPNRTETSADVCVDASFENGNEILDYADVGEDNGDVVDRVVEYKIVEGSTQRQRSKLVDSNGYSYVLKLKRTGVTYWRCCVQNAVMKCPATVVQKGGDFRRGPSNHQHEAQPGTATVNNLITNIKSAATENVFRPAPELVNAALLSTVDEGPTLPKPVNLARMANRARQRLQPEEPKDLDFDLLRGLYTRRYNYYYNNYVIIIFNVFNSIPN